MSRSSATARFGAALTAACLAVCAALGSAQEPERVESRPASAPAADGPAAVASICELHDEACAAVGEGDFESAVELAAEADIERRRNLRSDHATVASALSRLGGRFDAAGRADAALPLFEAARAMRERMSKGDHPSVATSLGDVADCLEDLGRAAEALPLYEAAAAMWERLYQGDHPYVATSLNNVALCLQALGRATEALSRYEAARAMRERLFKGDHPDVAMSLHHVAYCLDALGRATEALPVYEAARAMCERLYTGDHPNVAASLNNSARCLVALGRATEALPLHEAALAMQERLFKGDHPDVATSLNNVAVCLDALGRSAESVSLYEAARAMRRRLYKGDHPDVAASLNNVAVCLEALGRSTEAVSVYEAARAMRERLFKGDHADVAASLNGVASGLFSLGRAAEALPLYEAACAMRQRIYKGDHPEVANGLRNVATCLRAVGRSVEALYLHQAACEMRERLYKGDHPDVAVSLNDVALCLHKLGRAEEALSHYETARAMRERLSKGEHPDKATSLHNVAACLRTLGRAAEALPLLEAASDAARRRRYPTLGTTLFVYARCASDAGDLPRAARLLDEAAEVYESRRHDVTRLAERDRAAYEKTLQSREIYDDLSATRLRLGDVVGALAALERGRGRAALDLLAHAQSEPLAEARRRSAGAGDARQVAAIDSTVAAIAAAESDVARWTHAATAVFARRDLDAAGRSAEIERIGEAAKAARIALQAAETERARLIAEIVPLGEPATVDAARSLIAGKERMLTYFVGEKESWVFVLRPGDGEVAVYPLKWGDGRAVTATDLAAAVGEYLRGITDEGRAAPVRGIDETDAAASRAVAASSSEIGRRLLMALMPEAVWAEVRDAGRVEISADGALHRLPFEALVVEDAPTAAARRYWLDVGPQIIYATSASTSLEARRLRDGQKGKTAPAYEVLAVGDPIYAATEGAASRATPPSDGALVVRVADGSVGAAAGLRRGDVVVRFGARAITDAKSLGEAEESAASAAKDLAVDSPREIPLEVWRADGLVRLVVAPGALGVEVAREPPPAAWAALAAGDEAAVAVVERTGVLGRSGVLAPLPGTRREVEAISRTVEGLADPVRGRLKAKVLLGAEATETRVFTEAPKARILHFATHYLPEETDDGSFSALALTAPVLPSRDDDGFLRIHDVLNRWAGRLSAVELVVLSACDSKGSRAALEDGVFAMPIALLFAGVPSVVSSLWRVEDQSTADLMSDFYRRLFDPAANAATADRPAPTRIEHFTAARKAARARRPEPYFWAPFVWMGDPR